MTAGQKHALRTLHEMGGSVGYWQWRAECCGYAKNFGSLRAPRRFRRAWPDQLKAMGLIKIDDGIVTITNAGRAVATNTEGAAAR